MFRNRRTFLKGIGAAGITGVSGISAFPNYVSAGEVGGGSEFPKNYSQVTEREVNEWGSDYRYYAEVGDRIEFVDGPVYFAGTWRYAYRTVGCATVAKKLLSNGSLYRGTVLDGDHEIEVVEDDAPNEVSTYYHDNADWGIGASDIEERNYSWDNATIDTVRDLYLYFNSIAGTFQTATDIASYWYKASKNGSLNSGIKHHFDRYQQQDHVDHYMQFEVAIPPSEELSVNNVDIFVYNRFWKTKYEGAVNSGTNIPTGDFDHWYGITHGAIPAPSSATTSERKQFGIQKTQAINVPTLMTSTDISPSETVYLATKPNVHVWDGATETKSSNRS